MFEKLGTRKKKKKKFSFLICLDNNMITYFFT